MTSTQIRTSFLNFFKGKRHTIVPSSSLIPDSPNLLFTNAGMNQFVPIFLGQRKPDVNQWPGAIADADSLPTRAANTQKCIRAGGKHNDLEDVGFDTYHHTFFEMLGNWSFGDYFKQEAIQWAWDLLVGMWGFPPSRLYATVYKPGPGEEGEPDYESYNIWSELFASVGLDPRIHIHFGTKKDNFWMMGDTGPCGPCSEIHVDLTPEGNTQGKLINAGSPYCIEVWNLVFIQFNANEDGSLTPLPARHVDTGMGLERVAAIMQCTEGFKDFSRPISNYDTDIFRPIFDALERMSGKRYQGLVPGSMRVVSQDRQLQIDVAFRVIADHIRTVAFAIADGILPANTGRNYVVRRILRRAVRYGRVLGFQEPFFYRLVPVLVETMGDVFPELRQRAHYVQDVIRSEEETFNRTLDRGLELFAEEVAKLERTSVEKVLPGEVAFRLYDTYGFPLDLTELLARERGMSVDKVGFERLMEEQKQRARAALKKTRIGVVHLDFPPTRFVGYDALETSTGVLDVVIVNDRPAAILETSPCYPEMGGQVGDTGKIIARDRTWSIVDTQRAGEVWLHFITSTDGTDGPEVELPQPGMEVQVVVDAERRRAAQRHHTATHLLHWALLKIVGPEVVQKGSYVGPDKLTFDFNSQPLTKAQLQEIEELVNQQILEAAPVSWTIVPYAEVQGRKDIRQFFGEKYGETVRVVQIGGRPGALDGFSMELCGGTHCRSTGEIGLFWIVSESAVAAGVRRIEAVAGLAAHKLLREKDDLLESLCKRLNTPPTEVERKLETVLGQLKELEKQIKSYLVKQAANTAAELVQSATQINGVPVIIATLGEWDAESLQVVLNELKSRFNGVVLLFSTVNGSVTVLSAVSPDFVSRVQASKLVQVVSEALGGKGGGKPSYARGGGKDVSRIPAAIEVAKQFIAKC